MYGDWESVTQSTVAGLRALVGPDVDDPRLHELVGELSVRSLLDHPQVGPLELSYEKLTIPDTNCQTLVIYHAEAGTLTAQALALLATTAAGEREPVRSLAPE